MIYVKVYVAIEWLSGELRFFCSRPDLLHFVEHNGNYKDHGVYNIVEGAKP